MKKRVAVFALAVFALHANAQKTLRELIRTDKGVTQRFVTVKQDNAMPFNPSAAAAIFGLQEGASLTLLKTETEVHAEINTENTETDTTAAIHFNPLKELSNAAGFAEPERWWEHQIEYRKDHDEVFEAIGEGMGVMRT